MGGKKSTKKDIESNDTDNASQEAKETASGESPMPSVAYRKEIRTIEPVSSDLESSAPAVGRQNQRLPGQHASPSSVYPEPTHGIGVNELAAPPPRPKSDTKPNDKQTTLITWGVMLLGAIIIVGCGITCFLWIQDLNQLGAFKNGLHLTTTSTIAVVLSFLFSLLGIGIMLRRETGRALYMYMAVILFVVCGFGVYFHIKDANKYELLDVFISDTRKEIEESQKDSKLTDAQKRASEELIAEQTKVIKKARALLTPSSATLAEGFALAIIPVAILNIPRVKDVFE